MVAFVIGVLAMEGEGVAIWGWLPLEGKPKLESDGSSSRVCSLILVAMDSASLAVERRLPMWGRAREGVRVWDGVRA